MIVETRGLTKVYGETRALDGVDLRVQSGGVYGLVGPNGSGKTTLLSILAGLRRPTGGEVRLGIAPEQVAILPDTPQFEPWLSAREVVDLARNLCAPHLPTSRVEEVLTEAGLADAIDRRVGGFSRGMLQRLGLATTFVAHPRLLILDEPCSALDPAGRRDVLDLVKRLGREATVLFSSHILSDVEQVCDTVGIMRRGRLLYQGTLEELLVGHAVPAYRLSVRTPSEPLRLLLEKEPWLTAIEEQAPGSLRLRVRSMAEAEQHLPRVLAGSGVRVVSLAPEAPDLEDVFLELTQ
jgi:ABC-2 type transport system ATP-binding protein